MSISQRMELKLGQNLVMTPQLRQAIKLLELSHQDLSAYIQTEIDSNPFLDKDEATSANDEGEAGETSAGETYDANWRSLVMLSDYLLEQINLDFGDPAEKKVAEFLTHQLDENGYLLTDLQEVVGKFHLPMERIFDILKRLQQLEPPGIFARNLQECLEIQLADKDRLDPLMRELLKHLDMVGRKEYAKLCQIVGMDEEDLFDMLAELRNLDPKPGLHFGKTSVEAILPDILVTQNQDGSWQIELNASTLPRLIVHREYRSQISSNKEDKTYLNEKIAQANWLVRALDQRAQTILRVAHEIVRRQHDFLIHGTSHFKPLLRRDIAEELNIHESTVSRVTANKFMSTPKGTFALSHFFSVGLGDSQVTSSKSVMYLIKEEIKNEKRPLSDEQLVTILKKKGVDIARRTIAKYREIMKIPSSAQRRKDKAASSSLSVSSSLKQGRTYSRS